MLDSGRLLPTDTGLSQLDGVPMFPLGLQEADGWSAPFDNPWSRCTVRADQTTGPEQYSCAVAPSMTTNGGLGHDRSGAESGGAGADLCIPSNLYHAQIAQNLEPRLGSLGPFNTIYTRNAEAIRLGGGEHRVNSEIWDRAQYGFDPRCAVYEGEGPGYTGNTCPWDSDHRWDPEGQFFDSLADYLGLEPANASLTCGANPHTGARQLDLQALVVGSVEIGGQYQSPGFPGRMAWDANQPDDIQTEILSLTWFGEATPPVCAVPYRSTILRSPLLTPAPLSCDQCLFLGWDNQEICQPCLALTPPGQTQLGPWSAVDFPVDLSTSPGADGGDLEAALSYSYDASVWAQEMPPSILDCRNYPQNGNGEPDPFAATYHEVDSTGPSLVACSPSSADRGCATAMQDAFLCLQAPTSPGKECVSLMNVDMTFDPMDSETWPSMRSAFCPDEYGFDAAGLNYRWYSRPECPLHSAGYPAFPPVVVDADDEGARLPYPGSQPPFDDADADFYFNGWNDGTGTFGYDRACVGVDNSPASTLACSVEVMKLLEYDLDGDGSISPSGELLDNLIGMTFPDEMGRPAKKEFPHYLRGSFDGSPWLHPSCLDASSGTPAWQDVELCQEEGRTHLDYKSTFRGAFLSDSERLLSRIQRAQVEQYFPTGDDPLVFAQDGNLQNLTDQVLPADDAPANGVIGQHYPFMRLIAGDRTNASNWTQAYVRPLTWSRDRTRAFADLMAEVSSDVTPYERRPAWFSPQAIGEPACPSCATWDLGLGLNRARPMLEQQRVQAWMAIAEGIDGLLWYADSCPGGGPCALDEDGWELAAQVGNSAHRPDPMTLGEQVLEVASELRVHQRVFVGPLLEGDLTDDGEIDPWELDRSGPLLDDSIYSPPDVLPRVDVPGLNPDAPGAANFLQAGNPPVDIDDDGDGIPDYPIDTDGDGLANEPRKQDASAAVFASLPHPLMPGGPGAGNFLVVTNLKECRKYVGTVGDPNELLPVPPSTAGNLVSVVQQVNAEDPTLDLDYYLPCEGNADITAEDDAHPNNYFYGPDADWRSWQGTGGLFMGVDNEVLVKSEELHDGLIWCNSLIEEDLLLAADLSPDLWSGGSWRGKPVYTAGAKPRRHVEFLANDPLGAYDVRICFQSHLPDPVEGIGWEPWSTIHGPFPFHGTFADAYWMPPTWSTADPTVRHDPADAEIVPMCDRVEGIGIEPCDHSLWDWLKPTAQEPGFSLCTGCADETGEDVGGLVEEASDSWLWIPEPGSTFSEHDFTDIVDGSLCLHLKHEYEPGWDSVGGATQFDRASVMVSDANGCPVLGHGDPNNPCSEPLTTTEAWFLEDAGIGGPEESAVDLSSWLGQPIAVALRYQSWEDGVRTDGPGWDIDGAWLRWFDDDTKTCEELLGLQ